MFILFCDFLVVEQMFLFLRVKRSVIISNKLVYSSYFIGLVHKLVYNTEKTMKCENIRKIWKRHENIILCSVLLPKWKFCQYQWKSPENKNWTFSVVRYFTWKLEFFSIIMQILVFGNSVLHLTSPGPL